VLVGRYGPAGSFWANHPQLWALPIHSWQVWNEPNISYFWASGPSPAAYAHLLEAVGPAIHSIDPTAEVVAAGLPDSSVGINVGRFIARMYAAGARGSFDTFALHSYETTVAGMMQLARAVRRRIDASGDRGRPLWITEFGWATGGPLTTLTVSENQQRRLIAGAIRDLIRSADALRLRGLVLYRWRDAALDPTAPDQWPLHAGLLRADGTPKPSLAAFTDTLARHSGPGTTLMENAHLAGDGSPSLPSSGP
jgi:hypothetical protein